MKRLAKSFIHAVKGLCFAIRYEKNLKIHLVVAFLAIVLAFIFKLNISEFIILIIIILLVFIAELLNTIVELIIDYINPHFNQRAKIIKDLSAGVVLIVAINAVVIGIILFYPHLVVLF